MFDKKDLKDKIFVGIVENVYDDERRGRIQVRVEGIFNDILLEHIPWAEPQRSLDGRSFCVPSIGKLVNVLFVNGNIYEPQYIYSENYNVNLQEKLKNMSDVDYENFTAFLFDHQTQFFKDDDGLTIDHLYNKITMTNESINLELKNNNGIITLGSVSANQEAVLGTNFFKWMDGFMNTLLQPSSLVGNIGAPILKPQVDSEILKYQSLRQTFVSDNVFLNDDMKIDTLERESNVNMQDVDYKKNEDDLNSAVIPLKKLEKKKKKKKEKKKADNRPIEEKIAEKTEKEMDKMLEAEPETPGDPPAGNFIDNSDKNMNDPDAKEFEPSEKELVENSNVSDNPKSKPDNSSVETPNEDDFFQSYHSDHDSGNIIESPTYGSYSTGEGDDDTDYSNVELDATVGDFEDSGIEWMKCGAMFGKKSPYKYETKTRKVNPKLNHFINFLNIEMKKWNTSYSIKGVGGARSVEASLMTGKKGEKTIKSQLPDLWKIIQAMRKKYNIGVCNARSMTSNHVVGSAIDTKQILEGKSYTFGNRDTNPYKNMFAVSGYKTAMTNAIKKYKEETGTIISWGGSWSGNQWKSESHHFEISISLSERMNAISEAWEKGKEWRVERRP